VIICHLKKKGEKMLKRAFVSMLVLIGLIGLSSIALGLAHEEKLDQADEGTLDQADEGTLDQADEGTLDQADVEKLRHGELLKTIVLIGVSEKSFEDAIRNAGFEADSITHGKDPVIVKVWGMDAQQVRPKGPLQPDKHGKPPKIVYRAAVEFAFEHYRI
jgi:hypothetical protein